MAGLPNPLHPGILEQRAPDGSDTVSEILSDTNGIVLKA